jgi:hypothetical protein
MDHFLDQISRKFLPYIQLNLHLMTGSQKLKRMVIKSKKLLINLRKVALKTITKSMDFMDKIPTRL